MKREFSITNTTPGGQQTIHLIIADISMDEFMSCTDTKTVRSLCETGCVNYGKKWSCPPYSLKITDIMAGKDYDRVTLFIGYIFMDDMYYIKNPYQKVKAANMILKTKCENYARTLEKTTGGYALLSGSCNLCKPCYKKKDLPCRKPADKRYSLESTGVNAALAALKFCDHELLWYKKGESLLYTSVVTAVLHKGNNAIDFIPALEK